jgi:hypothetical protein
MESTSKKSGFSRQGESYRGLHLLPISFSPERLKAGGLVVWQHSATIAPRNGWYHLVSVRLRNLGYNSIPIALNRRADKTCIFRTPVLGDNPKKFEVSWNRMLA